MRLLFALLVLLLVCLASAKSDLQKVSSPQGQPVPSKTTISGTLHGQAGTDFFLVLSTFDSNGLPAACIDYSHWELLFSFDNVNATWVSCILGVYTVEFTPYVAGTNSFVLSLFGVFVTPGPVDFTVTAGLAVRCSFQTSSGNPPRVGTNITLGLVCTDQYSNPVNTCYNSSSWNVYLYSSSNYKYIYPTFVECSLSTEEEEQEKPREFGSPPNPPTAVTLFSLGNITVAGYYYVYARLNGVSIPVPTITINGGRIDLKRSLLSTSGYSTSGTLTFTPYDVYGNAVNPTSRQNDFAFSACPNNSASGRLYFSTSYVQVSYSLYNSPAPFCVFMSLLEDGKEHIIGGTFKGEPCTCEDDSVVSSSWSASSSSKAIKSSSSAESFDVEVELVTIMVALTVVGWLVGLLCGLVVRQFKNRFVRTPVVETF